MILQILGSQDLLLLYRACNFLYCDTFPRSIVMPSPLYKNKNVLFAARFDPIYH
jgi:hypothetical protein